jgi:hypothetical protein
MNLLYSRAYHLHCQLTLNSGRSITLARLNQVRTYAGLLEGTPNADSNSMIIEGSTRNAQKLANGALQVIAPPRRDYFRQAGDMSGIASRKRGWIPEWLPMITCIGSFESIGNLRDPNMDLSVLTIVWYQDEFALPILEPALSQILALDWEATAKEVSLY